MIKTKKAFLFVALYVVAFCIFYNFFMTHSRPFKPSESRRLVILVRSLNSSDGYNLTNETVAMDDEETVDYSRSIAVGGGLTSKKITDVTEGNIAAKFILFFVFIPSFCRTVSSGFSYHFYFAYDHNDTVFNDDRLATAFKDAFRQIVRSKCPKNVMRSVRLVRCREYAGKPTWAQNDAMMEAYLDNFEYFYRINDDTRFYTKGWTEAFIKVLEKYDPPRVGVVCPNHSGGSRCNFKCFLVHKLWF